ncbi:hypothetical protein BBP40_002626 [Aspergillus hancockii]|nr:hypothetical protein BBP40_002626 [Aspergillus hancockii]
MSSNQAEGLDPDQDNIQANRQLHQTLESACGRNNDGRSSRKHSLPPDEEDDYYSDSSDDYSIYTSVSGRFDDAEEEYTNVAHHPTSSPRSTHSAKRRRSNDWPVDEPQHHNSHQQQSQHSQLHQANRKETTSRWPFHSRNSSAAHGSSPRASGTASGRHGRQAGPSCRGRRSRFVEGMMNDSVSEKPPSIFLREKSASGKDGHDGPSQRHSGIFRFGKAIASAFNPFGGWGASGSSEVRRGAAENKQPADDAVARAEKAYAELKKAGYRGAVKGKYMEGGNGNVVADATWRSIQEKMDYKPAAGGRHSRQNSGDGHESGGSLRSSIQEVRRAKSSLGIASSLITRRSEEIEVPGEVRKQKSKKELQRQAKLLRRVSTLEEKLEKARRELQELMGEETPPAPERSQCQDPSHQRKFVPGALPSLPSERLLYTNDPVSQVSPTSTSAPPNTISEIIQRAAQEHENTTTSEQPSTLKPPIPYSLTVDSPSLKRKSPDPESASAATTPNHPSSPAYLTEEIHQPDSPRATKLPKTARGDSPGSVDRKQPTHSPSTNYHRSSSITNNRRSPSEERGRQRRSSQPLRSKSNRSPSARRRASNSRNRGVVPSLRMKKGRADLRSASAQAMTNNHDADKENQNQSQNEQLGFEQTDPTSPNSSPTKRKDPRYTYNYIPPVPPLPKDLAATAAKVDRRLAKEIEKLEARSRKPRVEVQGQGGKMEEGPAPAAVAGTATATARQGSFNWPDDIF